MEWLHVFKAEHPQSTVNH